MNNEIFKPIVLSIFAAVSLSACSHQTTGEAALTGGVTGAAVGAGTGAIIGSAITDGSVGKSALVGGAIGIPVGIATGIAVHEVSQANVREEYRAAVNGNQSKISANQREIDSLREEIQREGKSIEVDESYSGHAYDGPTVGNPRR